MLFIFMWCFPFFQRGNILLAFKCKNIALILAHTAWKQEETQCYTPSLFHFSFLLLCSSPGNWLQLKRKKFFIYHELKVS